MSQQRTGLHMKHPKHRGCECGTCGDCRRRERDGYGYERVGAVDVTVGRYIHGVGHHLPDSFERWSIQRRAEW
jgi:hypothetical protein